MLSRRQRRGLLVAGVALALLVGLYAAAGYLLAPWLIRKALIERAAGAGLEARVGAIAARPFRLVVDVRDLHLARRGRRLFYAPRLTAGLDWSSLWRRAWVLDRVALERPVVMALPAGEAGSAFAPPRFAVGEVDISQGTLALADAPRLEGVELRLHALSTLTRVPGRFEASAAIAGGGSLQTQGTLTASPLVLAGRLSIAEVPLGAAWRYLPGARGEAPQGRLDGGFDYRYAGARFSVIRPSAQARLRAGGSAEAHGELSLEPLAADLQLNVRDVPLALAEPWLGLQDKLRIASGAVSGEGRLRLGRGGPRYDGAALLNEVSLEDGQGAPLLACQRLELEVLHLRFSPLAVQAREVLARTPRVRLVISPQGELNLGQLFSGAAPTARRPGNGIRVDIDRLRIEQGELHFSDRSLESPFATTVQELSGAITRIATQGGEPARARLAGRVGKYGDALVRGAIELEAPAARTGVVLRLRNLALADFTPYAVKFAGYRIRSGRLTADLRYRVREERLVGDNRLVFDKLQLGEKVESASALDVPIDVAVALLTDAHGRISLAVPVSGDLRDPRFDLGGLMLEALHNTLAQIVSAPFRLLASLAGVRDGAGRLQAVRFPPGSAVVMPPQQEDLARVAKALAERPRLALSIRGGYDPHADLQALRRQALFRQLAQRAGYESSAGAGGSAPIDPGDPNIVRAAERLYLARGGDAFDLSRLGPRTPGYGRRLFDALAGATEVARDAAQDLAGRRAQAVRAALVADGVEAPRLSIDAPADTPASEAGVPTALRPLPAAGSRDAF